MTAAAGNAAGTVIENAQVGGLAASISGALFPEFSGVTGGIGAASMLAHLLVGGLVLTVIVGLIKSRS